MPRQINTEKIKSILLSFFNCPWKSKDFLTEDDVRCRLFSYLQKSLFNNNSLSIHSEIRWYGDDHDKLKYRSDIVIIDNKDIQDSANSVFKLPSKGYGFNKYYCIIEIKLRRRNNREANGKYNSTIKSDLKKLKEVSEKTTGFIDNKIYCVVAFDKKTGKKALIINHDSQNWTYDYNWRDWDLA